MIAVDTNILVYAHRGESPFHSRSLELITKLANGSSKWVVPWPCIHEFLAIATHPKIYGSTPAQALAFLEALFQSPSLNLIGETSGYWEVLRNLVDSSGTQGGKVHDARIAAICLAHGVSTLYSADRDFTSFPGLQAVNPVSL